MGLAYSCWRSGLLDPEMEGKKEMVEEKLFSSETAHQILAQVASLGCGEFLGGSF